MPPVPISQCTSTQLLQNKLVLIKAATKDEVYLKRVTSVTAHLYKCNPVPFPFSGAKKMCLKSVNADKQNKCTFLRKSCQLLDQKKVCVLEENDNRRESSEKGEPVPDGKTEVKFVDGFKYNPSGNDFRFNFSSASQNDNQFRPKDPSSKAANEGAPNSGVTGTTASFYKMQVSDNSFRFQFPDPGS